jgi:branched-chain amino acid transport system ATP-binding protein
MTLLETRNVTKAYGAFLAVSDVSFLIDPGKIHSIIGPNGAVKTTFFNLLAGVYSPTSGDIIFDRDGIIDHADYQNPRRPPLGISHILVEGVMAMNNGRLTGRKAGRFL